MKGNKMDWIYKLLGFKKMRVWWVDDKTVAIEHQENDDFEIPMSVIKQINPNIKNGNYIWMK